MEKELSFSILGVDDHATGDEIRAAYLTRLKTVHPKEDPEGFKRLRSAYESALAALEQYSHVIIRQYKNGIPYHQI